MAAETLVEVTLPAMGESVTEGTVVEFRKKPGAVVREGEPLVDVTTDKVDVEVPAPASGVLVRIRAREGETVPVGAVLAEIDTAATPAAESNGDGSGVVVSGNGVGTASGAGAAIEPTVVAMPEMGESVTEGTIVAFRKRPGERVRQGETLVEVTTDKVDVEVPAPADGVVGRLLAEEGATVAVGTPLVELLAGASVARPESGAPSQAETAPAHPTPQSPTQAPARAAEVRATPQARRIARKLDLDLTRVHGSGPDGLITRADVLAQRDRARTARGGVAVEASLPPLSPEARVTPLRGPAAALAGYMEASLSVPTATSFRTIPVDVLDARRAELNAALKAAGRTQKVSFTHLIAYALVRAAREMPFITHSFRRDGEVPVRVEPGIHLGLAVDAQRKDGSRFLVVPVVKHAAEVDFASFLARYDDLVARARDNKLNADDLQGASFTLTNPGGIGTTASVPRLLAGQGAIIATGAIGYPPGFARVPAETLRALGIGKVMQITSTYDHRVIQGAQSGEFLRRVEQLLQGADGFYEEVFAALGLRAGPPPVFEAGPLPSLAAAAAPAAVAPSDELLRAVACGMAIVSGYRTHGHLAARLDPLGAAPPGDPKLDPATYGLTPSLLAAVPASVLNVKVPGATLAEVLPRLREVYSSTIAYEVEHISNTEQRRWLREYIEEGRHRTPLAPEHRRRLLERLTRVEVFERFLRKTFLGQKTFSVEGLDALIPMLEEILEALAADGTETAVIGMAHRGRLNTIAHVVNVPYEEILGEFEAAHRRGEVGDDDVTGDVKYHHGATGTYVTVAGMRIGVVLANNPSHLEAVDPVVEGTTRALQSDHAPPAPSRDPRRAVPILIHGDAAFTGQGIVSEVFNLQALPGYATGGTLHIIANNQIGFTTDARDARSTRYASDPAKGFDVPIVHVNADDLEACIAAVRLAVDFRRAFGRDVIIDLIGYRRFGHNEQDEPAYTQPEMYERIKSHPTAREIFAKRLAESGIVTPQEADAMVASATERLQEAYRAVKERGYTGMLEKIASAQPPPPVALVTPDEQRLRSWSESLVRVPEGFVLNKKLAAQFERRMAAIAEKGIVDWGLGEALAFASLLASGVPVRLTGQDTERGTFSHRHAVLHAVNGNAEYVPLHHVTEARASFEIHNSPLSEYACLGFEYGYACAVPHALVLWEAQFGDFVNGAQIVIDQFIAAGQAKWGQTSRLTLLLPHGYEGQGPEHSSARLERFLQLTAEGNLRVASPSTAANYYHLLRLQAAAPEPVPLVVMTPKSLLRLEASFGSLREMAAGAFRPVIDDPLVDDKNRVERILLCTGKIYYDLVQSELRARAHKTAIIRIEMLSPLAYDEINAVIATYPNAKKLIWVQEEPKNMGARAYVRRRLLEHRTHDLDIDYIGRPYRASPSEGYPGAHAVEQERIVTAALTE